MSFICTHKKSAHDYRFCTCLYLFCLWHRNMDSQGCGGLLRRGADSSRTEVGGWRPCPAVLPKGLTPRPTGLILPNTFPPHTHTGASSDITGSFLSHVFAYAVPSDYLAFPSFSFPIWIQPQSHPLGNINEGLLPCLPKDFVPSQTRAFLCTIHFCFSLDRGLQHRNLPSVSDMDKRRNTPSPSLPGPFPGSFFTELTAFTVSSLLSQLTPAGLLAALHCSETALSRVTQEL